MASVAIVTGGTRGIGEAISVALVAAGAKVAATYSSDDPGVEAFEGHTGISARKWEIAQLDACLAGVEKVECELGPVVILVNALRSPCVGPFANMNRRNWDDAITSQIGGCFNMTKAVWPGMLARGFGRIVNIGSIVGRTGRPERVIDAAVQSALHGFTKSLAQEGAPAGITVNLIEPGAINGEPCALGLLASDIPVGRLGRAEDIARAVLFLCDEDAGFITGSTLSINGGQHMH